MRKEEKTQGGTNRVKCMAPSRVKSIWINALVRELHSMTLCGGERRAREEKGKKCLRKVHCRRVCWEVWMKGEGQGAGADRDAKRNLGSKSAGSNPGSKSAYILVSCRYNILETATG